MLFDFSSAFNTIQPVPLYKKLQETQLDVSKTTWIIDYQTNRPVCETKGLGVWEGGQQHRSSTGHCTLTVSLHSVHLRFPLYISESCLIQKHSDESAVVGCARAGQKAEYRELVDHFWGVVWEQSPHLEPEMGQTLSGSRLGVYLDSILDWKCNSEVVFKKGQNSLYLGPSISAPRCCTLFISLVWRV